MRRNIAVGTKLCGMKRGLLTTKDYEIICNMTSIKQITDFLKKKPGYADVFSKINSENVHREQLESAISYTVIRDYRKVVHYLNKSERSFISIFVTEIEIEQLKTLLRRLDSQTNFNLLTESYPVKYSFDFNKVAAASTLKEFIMALQGSGYYDVLSRFMVNTAYLTEFDIEMSLDMYFFKNMCKNADRLGNKALSGMLGTKVDILNLMWIYRCKKYFPIENEMIYGMIIDKYYKIRPETVKSAVESKNEQELLEILASTPYSKIFDESNMYFEEAYRKFMYRIYKNIFKEQKYYISGIEAYIRLKQNEINDITVIIEGIRYGLDKDEIRQHLTSAE